MHRGKVDPGVSELPQGNELSRDHVNRPLDSALFLNFHHIILRLNHSSLKMGFVVFSFLEFPLSFTLVKIEVWRQKILYLTRRELSRLRTKQMKVVVDLSAIQSTPRNM